MNYFWQQIIRNLDPSIHQHIHQTLLAHRNVAAVSNKKSIIKLAAIIEPTKIIHY